MILHCVTFEFRDDASDDLIAAFADSLTALAARLVELRFYAHGPALRLRPGTADYGVVALVDDEVALHRYLDDSIHVQRGHDFGERLLKARTAFQLEVPDPAVRELTGTAGLHTTYEDFVADPWADG